MSAAAAAKTPVDSDAAAQAAPGLPQVFTLKTAIVNGRGRLTVAGSTWLVTGPALPRGTAVRVIGVRGPRLLVEAAEEES